MSKLFDKLFHSNNKVYAPLRCRLGNQMFEYAMARSVALDTGGKPVLYQYDEQPFLLGCFELSPELEYVDRPYYSLCNLLGHWLKEKMLREPKNSPERFRQEKRNAWWLALCGWYICDTGYIKPKTSWMKGRNVHCFGWFQSGKYFEHHADVIRKELTFKQEVQEKCKALADEMKGCESVCLHIRLGDYLDPKYAAFKVCTKEYYISAVEYIRAKCPDARFYVFTDSPDIFEQEYKIENVTLIPESYTPAESLYLGTQCKHHIMSNSTFSWWMQWLGASSEQIVVSPKRWFSNDQVSEGMYMEKWIQV